MRAIARKHGGFATGTAIGHMWRKSRFLAPYLRNTLWEQGYALDTVETALPWNKVEPTALAIQAAIREALHSFTERVLVFAHLSHVYADGASIYTTYLFRRPADPDELLALQWGDAHLQHSALWTEFDERLAAAYLTAVGGSKSIFTDKVTLTTRDMLSSDITRLRSERIDRPLPIPPDAFEVYDNGQAQLYHLRPLTPFQP